MPETGPPTTETPAKRPGGLDSVLGALCLAVGTLGIGSLLSGIAHVAVLIVGLTLAGLFAASAVANCIWPGWADRESARNADRQAARKAAQ